MFCGTINGLSEEERPTCASDELCNFKVVYGDGSSTSGYYVTDLVNYNQVFGYHQTHGIANVTFGLVPRQFHVNFPVYFFCFVGNFDHAMLI